MNHTFDALIIGSGPAGLALAAALAERGLRAGGLSPTEPAAPWPNTFGIWEDELHALGLTGMLGHRWTNCVSYTDAGEIRHDRVYGLFDNARLQAHLLAQGAGVQWRQGAAADVRHHAAETAVHTQDGQTLRARIVIDASGHRPALVQRPSTDAIAFQAAYGIVGRFSAPPVAAGQLVLMDYRTDHLTPAERDAPPTFLYAMDLGNGRYFVEETSLAHAPAVPYDVLKQRLQQRLAQRGVQVTEVEHVEHCLFPMNMPLPYLDQPLLAYGGAASMVHPASGYQVGGALNRAAGVAEAVAAALRVPGSTPATIAHAGWQALWPPARLRKRALYLFGLENVLGFDNERIQAFFSAFFDLPYANWSGYLSDTLSVPALLETMLVMFGQAAWPVKQALAGSIVTHYPYLWRALRSRAH